MEPIGNKYLVTFEKAKAILHFESEDALTFTILERSGKPDDTSETVKPEITEIRPSVYLVAWQEASGTTVSQVHDYEKELIHSNWTSTDGAFYNAKGTIKKTGA